VKTSNPTTVQNKVIIFTHAFWKEKLVWGSFGSTRLPLRSETHSPHPVCPLYKCNYSSDFKSSLWLDIFKDFRYSFIHFVGIPLLRSSRWLYTWNWIITMGGKNTVAGSKNPRWKAKVRHENKTLIFWSIPKEKKKSLRSTLIVSYYSVSITISRQNSACISFLHTCYMSLLPHLLELLIQMSTNIKVKLSLCSSN
jgi:hypothetical protein